MDKVFVKKNVELEVRKGEKLGWFEVVIKGKKFVMKEVDFFYSEKKKQEQSQEVEW